MAQIMTEGVPTPVADIQYRHYMSARNAIMRRLMISLELHMDSDAIKAVAETNAQIESLKLTRAHILSQESTRLKGLITVSMS